MFGLYRVTGHSISMDQVRAYELQLQSRSGSSSSSDDSMELVTHAVDSEEGGGERTSAPDSESGRPHETETDKEKDETRVIKFAELKALIESGREDLIPNNKIIPNALNVSFSTCMLWYIRVVND